MSGVMKKLSIYGPTSNYFLCSSRHSYMVGSFDINIRHYFSNLWNCLSLASTVNIKRLLSYSSIENMGLIFCGLGMVLIARATENSFLFH